MRIKFLHAMTGSTPKELICEKQLLQHFADAGTQIDVDTIENGAESIESYFDIYIGAADTLRKIKCAERNGFDGVVITCFGNANLEPAREIASIPVIASGLASISLAATLCRRFSIIGTIPAVAGRFEAEVWKAGLLDKLASVRCINMKVQELSKAHSLTKEAMIKEARIAVEKDGAEVIVPGCFGMIGFAAEMQSRLGVPVVDPAGASVRLIETLVKLGLSQSKTAYPYPPDKIRSFGF